MDDNYFGNNMFSLNGTDFSVASLDCQNAIVLSNMFIIDSAIVSIYYKNQR